MSETLKFGNGIWATKKGSTLAYNSENGNFKPLPFTFDRSTSATRVNKEGLIEVVSNNEPRIDFKDNSKGALLLEPSRSNLVTYSEDFSNAYWLKSAVSVSSNLVASPKGDLTADSLTEDTSNDLHAVFINNSPVTISSTYTISVFVKSNNTTRNILLRTVDSGSNIEQTFFDLTTGTIVSNSSSYEAKIENYSNGWFRISQTRVDNSGGGNVDVQIGFANGTTISYIGNGVNSAYIWGAQLEQGSYPTSYIPTQGSIGTRVADACNGAGNEQVINSTEGVLYAEVSALADDLTRRIITITDGTLNNIVKLEYKNVSNQIEAVLYNGNTQCLILHTLSDETEFNKIAFKYKQDDFSLFVNGVKVGTDASGVVFNSNTLNNLSFYQGNSNNLYGNVKDLRVYNTALTDQELAALTQV